MKAKSGSAPFLLFDDARAEDARAGRLYRDPVEIIEAGALEEVEPALRRLKEARARGLHIAGYMSYEAGFALEPKLRRLDTRRREDDPPLLWFGLFEGYEAPGAACLEPVPETGAGAASLPEPLISREDYGAGFAAVLDAIVAGDIYQANFTFPCRIGVGPDSLAFYRAVRPRAAAGYGALIFTGGHWLLSFSPELFFTLEGGVLTARPMKGTGLRDPDPERDAANARALAADPKQRAENLMIVDLLRNDLSRIAIPGSVVVPDLFTVESYPTVHQMVSTVTARLAEGRDAVDVLAALFPCGSITGAPKIRAMEIIHETERRARGPYTGTIGFIDPGDDASFNVAIRTICVKDGAEEGVLGLGSGLVADSVVTSEWNECLDKGRFLSR